jgi:hypothetical protein
MSANRRLQRRYRRIAPANRQVALPPIAKRLNTVPATKFTSPKERTAPRAFSP